MMLQVALDFWFSSRRLTMKKFIFSKKNEKNFKSNEKLTQYNVFEEKRPFKTLWFEILVFFSCQMRKKLQLTLILAKGCPILVNDELTPHFSKFSSESTR